MLRSGIRFQARHRPVHRARQQPTLGKLNCLLHRGNFAIATNTGLGNSRLSNARTGSAGAFQIFDRSVKRLQRDRAAKNAEESRKVDYLRDEVANRLVERLYDINRSYEHVLDLGAGACHLARALHQPHVGLKPFASRIKHLTSTELSSELLDRDPDSDTILPESLMKLTRLARDEETVLLASPSQGGLFESNTFDAVISCGSLHWINDLPSVLSGINRVLKPDSPFLCAMFGGDTLYELRTSLQLAGMDRLGGVSPHVSPLADVRDMGGLLQRAGYKLITIDIDDIIVDYEDVFALVKDLQAMGEANAVLGRRKGLAGLSRDVLIGLEGIYKELHGRAEDGGSGVGTGIPATFRIIYMIGWKEGTGQQQPLKRGSGEVNLKDILGEQGGLR
ncbi:hypothetical protein TWF569_002498 [Orbilia oligospora]|uniref:Methyltransferase type 11 domain-containing protein n=1 Tax=Orbilia oligospora TaxID=2813651 RepID=A0A7C8JJ71_ORBOL|nr:hypothetical protein TWF102_003511 [Orbilia oligospora]KAF3080846.1 hypothetical protein TWF103_003971 [Orbilia oligospora]KAF3110979.1 hypothetical protein TWF706_000432 [Orbilia oligospora]KAF3121228.1 hypothetical protein TWF703_001987 [Orbilia oligospora]KAF3121723.1 hypothetical protein TWF569_002498 [Orbilia oligospora]